MHIVLKFQIFISIFTMAKLQKKTPKIFKWGKMGVARRCDVRFRWHLYSFWLFVIQKTKATIDDNWQVVFVTASVIHFIGVTFYALFASGDLQPWAEPKEEEDELQKPPAPVAVAWNPFDPNAQKAGFNAEQPQNPDYNTTVSLRFMSKI